MFHVSLPVEQQAGNGVSTVTAVLRHNDQVHEGCNCVYCSTCVECIDSCMCGLLRLSSYHIFKVPSEIL